MITSILLYIITALILVPTIVLPEGKLLPQLFYDSASYLNQKLYFLNAIIPIDTIVILTAISITFAFLALGFRIIMWIVSYIRGTESPA